MGYMLEWLVVEEARCRVSSCFFQVTIHDYIEQKNFPDSETVQDEYECELRVMSGSGSDDGEKTRLLGQAKSVGEAAKALNEVANQAANKPDDIKTFDSLVIAFWV